MLESSIYWTADELKKIGVNLSKAFKVDESVSDSKALYYAYWDGSNPSSYCYKNIQISNYTDSSVNLLQYYGIPKFDSGNTRILRLPTKQNFAPPSLTEILVTIKKDFCYEVNKVKIPLNDDYQWSYCTNGGVDNDNPEFINDNNNGFVVTVVDEPVEGEPEQNSYKETNFHMTTNKDDFTNSDIYIKSNIKNKKLWVRGSFTDAGSGPDCLKWELHKVNNSYYPCTTESKILQTNQLQLNITGTNASVNPSYEQGGSIDKGGTIIELDNLTEDGFYRIDFLASDKNERTATKSFYFVYDITPPATLTKNNITDSRTSASQETFTLKNLTDIDFAHLIIEQYDVSSTVLENKYTSSTGVNNYTVTNLIDQKKYTYRLYVEDICGHKSSNYLELTDNTAPAKVTINWTEGKNGRVILHYTTPNDVDYAYHTISTGSSTASQSKYSGTDGRNKSIANTYNGKSNGTEYKYYIRTYDYSGNASAPEELKEMAGAVPGMICYAPNNNSSNIFCSKYYWSGKNAIGIVADGSNQTNVKILALDQQIGYCYGPEIKKFNGNDVFTDKKGDLPTVNGSEYFNNQDGLEWYKLVRDNADYQNNIISGSIWDYLKNVKNKNSAVTWWVPARHEWQYVCWNWSQMQTALNTIKNGGGSAANMVTNGIYFVGGPTFFHNRCDVIGINTNDEGRLSIFLAQSTGMKMYTTPFRHEHEYYKTYTKFHNRDCPYVRAMAFVNMK